MPAHVITGLTCSISAANNAGFEKLLLSYPKTSVDDAAWIKSNWVFLKVILYIDIVLLELVLANIQQKMKLI